MQFGLIRKTHKAEGPNVDVVEKLFKTEITIIMHASIDITRPDN